MPANRFNGYTDYGVGIGLIVLVTDPDYTVTNLYGLRWDAPHETAYPSTFVLDKKGMIVFEKISHSHGDRLSAQDALDHLAAN
jgi:peroxiredoxin